MASKKDISDDIKDVARELEELSTGSLKSSVVEKAKEDVKTASKVTKRVAKSAGAAVEKVAKKAVAKAKETNLDDVKAATKKAAAKAQVKAKEVAEKAAVKVAQVAAKAEIKKTAVVEYAGNQYMVDEIIARCEAKYKADNKRKAYKDIKVYIKPENNAAYYVVDDKSADKIDLI